MTYVLVEVVKNIKSATALSRNMETNFVNEVLKIVRKTRDISLPFYGIADVKGQKSDFAVDVVTQVDIDIENFLKAEFFKLDPTITFAGEEFGGDRNQSKFWLVDPVDGTAHFVRGMPFCTTMVALIENGEVIFSAIYDFVTDTMYHAIKGEGAFRNLEKIKVSDRNIKESYLVAETHLNKIENYNNYLKLQKNSVMFHTVSCGFEFSMIASGKLEGRIMFDPFGHDWDYAPGSLLVSEAGGIVKNIGSDKYDFKNLDFIAANPLIYKALTEGGDAVFPINK